MATFTERQAKAFPEAITEAQRYVDGHIHDDITHGHWTVSWAEEFRPGRGQQFSGVWCDGEHLVHVLMDVYGYPSVSVAEVTWLHSSSDEECDCDPCTTTREDQS